MRSASWISKPPTFGLTLVLIAIVSALVPAEKSLGKNLSIILLHGSWVWTGLIAFGMAGLTGLAALTLNKNLGHMLSQSIARTGMVFWLTYLPMSLIVMQISWGGFFLDEPRWRVPFTFAAAGLLLQIGLTLIEKPVLNSIGNILFGTSLWLNLVSAQNILHPDSPISQSRSSTIPLFFGLLLFLTVLLGIQVTSWWFNLALRKV